MVKRILTNGFKLFQPWATDVVKGKLNFLIRSINTKKRERVVVIATKGLDGTWLEKASLKEIENVASKVGAIGSVNIKDCLKIKPNKVESELTKIAGLDYWDYYPKYLIPSQKTTRFVYIWVLDNAKEWKDIKPIRSMAMTWVKLFLEDEKN